MHTLPLSPWIRSRRTIPPPIIMLVLGLMLLAACAPTTTPFPVSCNTPQIRYFARDVIAVSLIFNESYLPVTSTPETDAKLLLDIATRLNGQPDLLGPGITVGTPSSEEPSLFPDAGFFPRLVKTANRDAIAFYTLNHHDTTNTTKTQCDQRLLSAITNLNQAIATQPQVFGSQRVSGVTFALTAASPDWYFATSESNDMIRGGPGGLPTYPAGKTLQPTAASPSGSGGGGATIVVLDTSMRQASPGTCPGCYPAPLPITEVDLAQTTTVAASSGASATGSRIWPWNTTRALVDDLVAHISESPALPLMSRQPTPQQRAKYHINDQNPYTLMDPKNQEPVNVGDHGLFVAAIAHSLAPQAHILSMPVLNPYGVGDLYSLTSALAYLSLYPAMYGLPDPILPGQVFLNMSVTAGPPTDCLLKMFTQPTNDVNDEIQHLAPLPTSGTPTAGGYASPNTGCDSAPLLKSSMVTLDAPTSSVFLPLGIFLQDMQSQGFTMIAAAGNDSTGGAHHYSADMPAAFCSVTAVAATEPVKGGLAVFSNDPVVHMADGDACLKITKVPDPFTMVQPIAITPELATGPGIALPGMDICSLHPMKAIPSDLVSPTDGLSLWSGTSFATSIETGLLAAGGTIFSANLLPCTAN